MKKHEFLSVIIGLILAGFLTGCPKLDPWVTVADSDGGDEIAVANGDIVEIYGNLLVYVYDVNPEDVSMNVYGAKTAKTFEADDMGWVALGASAVIAGVGLWDGDDGGLDNEEFYQGAVELNRGETVMIQVFIQNIQEVVFFARHIADENNDDEGENEGENGEGEQIAETMPVITLQPNGLNVAIGTQVTFHVEATGGGLHYQWLNNDVPITANPASTGVNTNTLTILSAGTVNNGWYSCVVSNSRGSVESNPAQLTVGTANPGGTINIDLAWNKSANVLAFSATNANAGVIGLELYHQTGGSPWIERQVFTVTNGSANGTVNKFRPNMLRFGVVSNANAGDYLPFSALSVRINGTAVPLVDNGGNNYAYQVDVSTLP